MTDESAITVTLKAGTGFDAPWIVIRGSNAVEVRKLIAEAFYLADGAYGDSVDEAAVAAAINFAAIFTAAKGLGPEPKVTVTEEPAKPASKGIAAQAKEAEQAAQVATPTQATSEQIAEEIRAAATSTDITLIYKKYQNNGWGDEHKAIATARRNELKEKS